MGTHELCAPEARLGLGDDPVPLHFHHEVPAGVVLLPRARDVSVSIHLAPQSPASTRQTHHQEVEIVAVLEAPHKRDEPRLPFPIHRQRAHDGLLLEHGRVLAQAQAVLVDDLERERAF